MEEYGIAVLLAAFFNLGIGIRTFMNPHRSKIAEKFFLVTLIVAFWGGLEALSLFLENSQAFFWIKLSYIPFFLLPSAVYFLAYHVSGSQEKILSYVPRILYVLFIVLIFTDLFIQKTSGERLFIPGVLFEYMALAHMTIVVMGFFFLYSERIKLKGLGRLHRVDVMIYGFVISLIFAYIFEVVSPWVGWELPKIGSLFTVFGIVAFIYSYSQGDLSIYPQVQRALTTKDALCGARCSLCPSFFAGRCESCVAAEDAKRKMCQIYQCAKKRGTNCHQCDQIFTCSLYIEYKECCPFLDSSKALPYSSSYRVDSTTYDVGRSILRDSLIFGDFGLMISREHPDIFFEKWDLEELPLIWLSSTEENKWSVNPTDMAKLAHIISNFIEEYPNSIILFEGFEYLMVHNSFDTIMNFAYSVDDQVVQKKSKFIVSYDSRAFDREKLALLEKELKPLPSEYIIEKNLREEYP